MKMKNNNKINFQKWYEDNLWNFDVDQTEVIEKLLKIYEENIKLKKQISNIIEVSDNIQDNSSEQLVENIKFVKTPEDVKNEGDTCIYVNSSSDRAIISIKSHNKYVKNGHTRWYTNTYVIGHFDIADMKLHLVKNISKRFVLKVNKSGQVIIG